MILQYLASGAPDPSFPPQQAAGPPRVECTLEDGRVLGAYADTFGPYETEVLERFTADGTLDTSYGTAGSSDTIPFWITQIVPLPGGRTLVAGHGLYAYQGKGQPPFEQVDLALLTAEGKLEASFGSAGIVKLRSAYGLLAPRVRGILVQGNDFIVGADSGIENGGSFVARLTATGTLDPTFGSGGAIVAEGSIFAMRLRPDDRFVVAENHGGSLGGTASLNQYTANGQPDATFGTDGVDTVAVGAGVTGHAVLWGEDGSALVGGGALVPSVACERLRSCEETPVLMRFSANGQLDRSFGGGVVQLAALTEPEGGAEPRGVLSLAARRPGAIVAAGGSGGSAFLAAFGAGGELEPSFGEGGIVSEELSLPSAADVRAITTDPRGRILVFGSTDAGARFELGAGEVGAGMVARYARNGRLDTNFGTEGGFVPVPGEPLQLGADRAGRTIALTQGSTLVGINPRGRYDQGFGKEGFVFLKERCHLSAEAMVALPGGDVLVSGRAFSGHRERGMAVCRLNADGSLDPAFGRSGRIRIEAARLNAIRAMAVQGNGRILLVGAAYSATASKAHPASLALMRLMANGRRDFTFADRGRAVSPVGPISEATDVAVEGGRIYVAGSVHRSGHTRAVLLSYNRTGHLTSGFGHGGIATAAIRKNTGRFYRETVEVVPAAGHLLLIQSGRLGNPLYSFSLRGRLEQGFIRQLTVLGGRLGEPYGFTPHGTLQAGKLILAWNAGGQNGLGGYFPTINLARFVAPEAEARSGRRRHPDRGRG